MPPIPPPLGMGGASSLISVMTASAVVSREATPDASVMALRTTFVGSMMPASIMLTNLSLRAS